MYKACFQKSTICAQWIAINVDMTSWRCDITWRLVFVNMEKDVTNTSNLWLTVYLLRNYNQAVVPHDLSKCAIHSGFCKTKIIFWKLD